MQGIRSYQTPTTCSMGQNVTSHFATKSFRYTAVYLFRYISKHSNIRVQLTTQINIVNQRSSKGFFPAEFTFKTTKKSHFCSWCCDQTTMGRSDQTPDRTGNTKQEALLTRWLSIVVEMGRAYTSDGFYYPSHLHLSFLACFSLA